MSLTQFDVCTAFLYGKLNEEVSMKQPQGYEDGSDRVCKLHRSLHGLKQAPRCWNQRFSDYFQRLNFKKSVADPCLYIKKDGGNMLLLALYVDDGLLASTSETMKDTFIHSLQREFKITVKPASYFLDLEIEKKEAGTIQVNQSAYTKKILERFGMQDCRLVSTPIVKEGIQLGKEDEDELNSTFPYRGAFLENRELENPSNSDCSKVKRIFHYLKGSTDLGIIYEPGAKEELKTFSDADHGGDDTTGRSTTGVFSMYADGAISWYSQRQTSVAISTTEAEIVAASEAARGIVWLKRLFEEIIVLRAVPTLMVDNEAAIKLAENPEYHRRTEHIHIRHFFVRELVLDSFIQVKKVSSEDQLADIMTKPLFKPRLQMLRNAMGLTRIIQ
ncbi:hypothetical protein JTB14_024227 [Gonioctena quinquepunctata]|nr:hypothetical protein JTB14_024227 [Gonioctena quinquepunctata]